MSRRAAIAASVSLIVLIGYAFVGSSLWVFLVALSACWVIIGVGSNVVLGMSGVVVLHGAACMSIAAYAAGILQNHGWIWPAAVLGGTAIGSILMTVVMLPLMRLEGFFVAVSSFMIVLLVEVIMNEWESLTNGPYGLTVLGSSQVGSITALQMNYLLPVVFAVLSVVAYTVFRQSPIGVRIRASRDSRVAAQASGTNVFGYRLVAFVVGNTVVALGGALMAPLLGVIDPAQFGLAAILSVLFVTWLGGLDVPAGPVVGAAFVSFVPQLLTGLQTYTGLVNGVILLLILVLCPAGILGLGRKVSVLR